MEQQYLVISCKVQPVGAKSEPLDKSPPIVPLVYPVGAVPDEYNLPHISSVYAPPALVHTCGAAVPEYPLAHVQPVGAKSEPLDKSPPIVPLVYPVGAVLG